MKPVASSGLRGDDGSTSFRRTEGFDTSATEATVAGALARLGRGRTTIVAHRPATAARADRILTVADGRIASPCRIDLTRAL